MPLVGGRGGLGRGLASLVPDAPADPTVEALSQRVEALSRMVSALESELAMHRLRTEALSAEQMCLEARAWIGANPDIWGLVAGHARAAAHDRRRFSMKREFEDLRDEYAPAGEMRWKFRNSLTAPLARFLLQEVPEVGPYMALGRSKVDRYFDGTCSPPEAAGCDA